MAGPLTLRRDGDYYRLADPGWTDPLDTSFSRDRGGRWNPAGAFGVLYLNRDVPMARVQVEHKVAGHPYGAEDLDPGEQHDLVELQVPEMEVRDCVTDDGLRGVELPDTCPRDALGRDVTHSTCQPIGQAANDEGLPGLACRSAAAGADLDDEELAVFDTHVDAVELGGRKPFAEWFYESA